MRHSINRHLSGIGSLCALTLSGCGSHSTDSAESDFETAGSAPVRGTANRSDSGLERGQTEYAGLPCIRAGRDADRAWELYLQLAKEGKEEGYTPVIVALNDPAMDEMLEFAKEDAGSLKAHAQMMLEAYPSIDTDAFFADCRKLYEEQKAWEAGEGAEYAEAYGQSGEVQKKRTFYGYGQLGIVKAPTANPFEVFAYLPFGGYNDCPLTEEHIAVAERWYKVYGAVPCSITSDTVQYYLESPVENEEAVIDLTAEMYRYCYDILDPGVGTIDNLSAIIRGSRFWFFWWD